MKLLFARGTSNGLRLLGAGLLAIVLMVADHRFGRLEGLRSAIATLTYPLQLTADLPMLFGRTLSESFSTRDDLLEKNRQLRETNIRLSTELQQYEALLAENERLRDLLGSSFKVGNRVLIAEISAVDLDPFRHQVLIRKGTTSGIFVGQAVLDAHGVMGQVIHTAPYNATVLLITDASHALPVQVLRTGLRTVAIGSGKIDQLDLPYLPNNLDVEAGDLLVTSGLGGVFPPGYPVARISDIQLEPGRPFATVTAQPLARLDRSREVLLVWKLQAQPSPDPAVGSDQPATGNTGEPAAE